MTFDEQLDLFEETIRKVKIQFDLYFAGIRKNPPTFERGRLDSMLHEMSRVRIRDVGTRFRFNTLTARYNQYREYWSRQFREREEGPMDWRRRTAALASGYVAARPTAPIEKPPGVTFESPESYVEVTQAGKDQALQQLHSRILEAQKALGSANGMSLQQVSSLVDKQMQTLGTRFGVSSVGFRVETVDGKVKLKAKPIKN